jgi:hypothetical protein
MSMRILNLGTEQRTYCTIRVYMNYQCKMLNSKENEVSVVKKKTLKTLLTYFQDGNFLHLLSDVLM